MMVVCHGLASHIRPSHGGTRMSTLLLEPKELMPKAATPTRSPRPDKPRATAETMATKQREISVSEFFAKNRHLLGFDNPRKAMLTTVKEAVDNSLDACEEAGILPDITVIIEDLQPDRPASAKSSRYRVTIIDNGPGIVRKQVEHIFGRLLYGSKFHRLKMSRGQQGIGISAAGMYGLLTTGRPMVIHTRPGARKEAHHIELAMNTKTNRAEVTVDDITQDFPPARFADLTPGSRELAAAGQFLSPEVYRSGTSVTVELEGKYQRGRGSVDEFLELTAIANPHARITFVPPSRISTDEEDAPLLKRGAVKASSPSVPSGSGEASAIETAGESPTAPPEPASTTETGGITIFPRGVEALPTETKEIQPHPKGVELGTLLQMMKEAEAERANYSLFNFLQDKFCRVSAATAGSLCRAIGVTTRTRVGEIDPRQAEALYKQIQDVRLPPPPTDCLAPIGVRNLLAGLLKGVKAEFYAASSRNPDIYRGRPFQIEAAIAFGGDLPADEPARVIRFANRVPLQYQQSACSSFKAVLDTNWRNYDLQQPRGGAPVGPLVVMIHMASVWVPFTSESKEAIADYDEIRKEMKLALQECGRKLGVYLRKRAKMRRDGERRDVFQKYIGEIAKAVNAITGVDAKRFYDALLDQAKKKTAIADLQLDEDGQPIRDEPDPDQEGVIIVESGGAVESVTPRSADSSAEPGSAATPAPGRPGKRRRVKPDDDNPTLLDAEPERTRLGASRDRRRANEPLKRRSPRVPSRRSGTSPSPTAPDHGGPIASSSASPESAGSSAPPAPPVKRKIKTKLVNGTLVPVGDEQLF